MRDCTLPSHALFLFATARNKNVWIFERVFLFRVSQIRVRERSFVLLVFLCHTDIMCKGVKNIKAVF